MTDTLPQEPADDVCPTHGCEKDWVRCWDCGGEGYHGSACWDDLCHGRDLDGGECMHGDDALIPCDVCQGRGGYRLCQECAPGAFYDN